MKIKDVKKLDTIERFCYWITEREAIRLEKKRGAPKPWTDDEILQKYKFCNVRRMNDRVSVWLMRNWYAPHVDHPNILVACAMARHFNHTGCLEELGFPKRFSAARILDKLERRAARQECCFSGAYMISGRGGRSKIDYVVKDVLVPIYEDRNKKALRERTSIKALTLELQKYHGIGSFLAGQISADMRWATQGRWEDRRLWAPMGPGSRRGMLRLYGRSIKDSLSAAKFDRELPHVIDLIFAKVPYAISGKLEAIDCQNCLCEFDKYERTLWENRPPKQRYPGA